MSNRGYKKSHSKWTVSQSAERAFWWARALGCPPAYTGGPNRLVGLVPFDIDRVPLRRGWNAWSRLGDPAIPSGLQRDWLVDSARPNTKIWAWALLPGQAGLVVVDVDDPKLRDKLVTLYGPTPVRVATPSGGVHLYYLAPPVEPGASSKVISRIGVRGDGTYDIKADAVTCHAPGSRHHDLRDVRYTIESDPALPPGDPSTWKPGALRARLPTFRVEIAELDWMAHHATPETPDESRARVLEGTPEEREWARRYCDAAGPAVSGCGGHIHTVNLAFKLGDFGYPLEVAREILRAWNQSCEPPWTDHDLDVRIDSCYKGRDLVIGWRADEVTPSVALNSDGDGDDCDELTDDEISQALALQRYEDAAERSDNPVPAVTRKLTEDEYETARQAAVTAQQAGKPKSDAIEAVREAVPGVAVRTAAMLTNDVFAAATLPHVDIDDLFADIPAAHEQCHNVKAALRMSSTDVPALFALGFASAALAARCRINAADGWKPPPHLFVVASVPSGRGKSSALDRMGGTLTRRWQTDLGIEWEAEVKRATRKREVTRQLHADFSKQITRYTKALMLAKSKGENTKDIEAQLAYAEQSAETFSEALPVSKPIWIQADSTPEKFVNMVKEHGFALLMAGEGRAILQAFTQGSVGQNRTTSLLSAWTGESLDRARVGNTNAATSEQVRVDRYADLHACMVLPVQHFVLEPNGEDRERTTVLRELAASGFFARCLVTREELSGHCTAPAVFDGTWRASVDKTAMRPDVQAAWESLLTDIWLSGRTDPPVQPLAPESPDEPYMIELDTDALDHLLSFQEWAAEQGKADGIWADERVAESAARIGEQAIRVAAVLACMRARSCKGVSVSLADAERAVRFCHSHAMPLISHLLNRAKPDPIADDAAVVREKIKLLARQYPDGNVPKRRLHQGLGRGWGKENVNARTSRLDAALEYLETVDRLSIAHDSKTKKISTVKYPPKT